MIYMYDVYDNLNFFRGLSHNVLFLVMSGTRYEVDVYRQHILLGNDAILTCHLPAHFSAWLVLQSWRVLGIGAEFYRNSVDYGIQRARGTLTSIP